ncbi:MAG: PfkB family carbohydrate kinase [Halanaeroarchaeum sp.]
MRDIRHLLASEEEPTITVLPDGSVDHRYAIVGPDGDELSRQEFATDIHEYAKTFLTRPLGEEPGGQSVNAARQVHELGANTSLVSHLDHPIFASLPFETYSMGDPADIHVYELADGVTMFAIESADIDNWTFHRVREAVGPAYDRLTAADAILWTNWDAFPHATEGLSELVESVDRGNLLVIDPGAVSTRSPAARREFLETLRALSEPYDVVLSPNRREADRLAEAIGIDGQSVSSIASALRNRAGIDAVVIHDVPAAAVATHSGVETVPTVDDAQPSRHAGGGDRFSAGVAYARAHGWDWPAALTLGNATATFYVIHGRSGTASEIADLIAETI